MQINQSKTAKKTIAKNTIVFLTVFAYNNITKNGKDGKSMQETRTIEFKETITNTFLKTVSAFSNYNGERFSLELMTAGR